MGNRDVSTDDGLALLNPRPLAVEVGGKSIVPPQVRIGGLDALQEACRPIMVWLAAFNFSGAMVNARGDAVHFLVVGANVDQAFVETLTIADAVLLGNAVMEVNADFFVQLLAETAATSSTAPDETATIAEAGLAPLPD